MKLTERESYIILEALELWEEQPIRRVADSGLMGAIMGGLSKSKELQDDLKMQHAKEKTTAEVEKLSRKKEAILLKAKIIESNQ